MIQKVEEYCKKNRIINKGDKIIIGLSGGADSVCLFFVLLAIQKKYNLTLQALHIHHGIRGSEADRDAAFAEELCRQHQIPCIIERYPVLSLAEQQGISVEAAGRQIRYRAMEQLRKKLGFTKIAVAHHRNDQAETILFHLCRGSGLAGLRGMQPSQGKIIRPLLFLNRLEIESFLKERNQDWCMDSTNLENNYSRNFLRNQILPLLAEEINAETVEHIASAGEILGEAYHYIQKEAKHWADRLVRKREEGRVELNREGLLLLEPFLRKELYRQLLEETGGLRDITAVHLKRIDKLLFETVGHQIDLPNNRRFLCTYQALLLERKEQSEEIKTDTSFSRVLAYGETYVLPSGAVLSVGIPEEINQFCLKNGIKREKIMEENPCTKCFDYDTIKDTLKLRTREVGDYLELGAGFGRKSLKKYFIDKKISREERDRIPLIAEGKHILWVIGYRISAGYKVTETTKTILQIKINGGQKDGREDSCIIGRNTSRTDDSKVGGTD